MKRLFHFQDVKSNKFWEIERTGDSFTVRFGKIGTNGQTQTKEFADSEKTEKEYNKLVAEKLKKGYVEQGGTGPAVSTSTAPVPAKPKKTKAVVKPKPEVVDEAESVPATEPDIARKLNLRAEDWFWATWRELEPLKKPKPANFDYGKMEEKWKKARKWSSNWYDNPGVSADSGNTPFSREEAVFWIEAMQHDWGKWGNTTMKVFKVDIPISNERLKDFVRDVSNVGWERTRFFVTRLLTALFPTHEMLDWVLDLPSNRDCSDVHGSQFAEAFMQLVRVYLPQDEFRPLQDQLRDRIKKIKTSDPKKRASSFEYRFAAVLGLHDEVGELVSQWETTSDAYAVDHGISFLFFGLGSPDLLQREWKRCNLRLLNDLDLRKWLAHTELTGLDEIAHSTKAARIDRYTETSIPKELAKTLSKCVLASEAAPSMVALKLKMQGGNPKAVYAANRRSQGTSPAEDWLVKNPELAIAGLLETATQDSELGKEALAFLKIKLREGFKETLEKHLSQQKPEVVAFLQENLFAAEADAPAVLDDMKLPKSLQNALAETKTKGITPPLWASFAAMPPILIDGAAVSGNLYENLIGAVDKSKFEQPAPLILAIRETADKKSLEDWSFALFDAWVKEAFPPDAKWALKSLGYFGGDRAAFHLVPYIRAWPSDGGYARSVLALDCLRAIGSDVALMQLNGIAQKCTTKGLKKHAAKLMEEIAAAKQLTRPQLEDRIVPDCDLDERGQKSFDFGPRRFYFALGPDMKPKIKDEDGKLRDDLPKPSQKDDIKKAESAVAEWKVMKKTLRDLVKVQSYRLEQAMVTQRRWTPEEFETLLVRHPLMTHLVRLVVWGVFEQKGNLVSTFRVTDEQDFADLKDAAFTLPKDGEIRLVHPLDLDISLKTKWGEVFDDYRIVPPFPQLGREVFGLEKGEKTKLERWKKVKINGATLSSALERLGWDRGYPESGYITDHSKQFSSAGVTAIVEYEPGIPIYDLSDSEEQTIHFVRFIPGLHHVGILNDEVIAAYKKDVPLEKADRIAVSEVINDLNQVAAKGNEA